MIDHLRHGLRREFDAVLWAIRIAGARIQQAQIVVDFRHRAHGGARIVRGGFLLDGNRGREALDQIHVRLFHQLQELPRIRRERFDIAALAFGIQRIESERGFTRARQAGNHHQLIARDVETDVLEVVGAGAANANKFHVSLLHR